MAEQAEQPGYSKVLGLGESVEFEGVAYPLTPFGYERRAEFEVYCKRLAREELRAMAKTLRPEEYDEERRELTKLITSGYYNAGQEGFDTRLKSVDGQTYMFWLMLSPKSPKLEYATVERMAGSIFKELADAATETNRAPVLPNGGAVGKEKKSPS